MPRRTRDQEISDAAPRKEAIDPMRIAAEHNLGAGHVTMRVVILKAAEAPVRPKHGGSNGGRRDADIYKQFSPQQREIAALLLKDMHKKQIATKLRSTHLSVNAQVLTMKNKMGVKTTWGLVRKILETEVVTVDALTENDLVLNQEAATVRRGLREVSLDMTQYLLLEKLARLINGGPVHVERLAQFIYGGKGDLDGRAVELVPTLELLQKKVRPLGLNIANPFTNAYVLTASQRQAA